MKIIVKGIHGGSCVINAQENTTIRELKRRAANDINIPVSEQSMLHSGKTLQDDDTLGSYPTIQDGCKLFVAAIHKPDTLEMVLLHYLAQFYTEQQCYLIVDEFMRDFVVTVAALSLDDLERIAKADMGGIV